MKVLRKERLTGFRNPEPEELKWIQSQVNGTYMLWRLTVTFYVFFLVFLLGFLCLLSKFYPSNFLCGFLTVVLCFIMLWVCCLLFEAYRCKPTLWVDVKNQMFQILDGMVYRCPCEFITNQKPQQQIIFRSGDQLCLDVFLINTSELLDDRLLYLLKTCSGKYEVLLKEDFTNE